MKINLNLPEKELIKIFKEKLSRDKDWVQRAIVVIYNLQTEDEKVTKETSEKNGMGFSGVDAKTFSEYAKIINDGWDLKPDDLRYAFRRIPHYARQLVKIAKSKQQK